MSTRLNKQISITPKASGQKAKRRKGEKNIPETPGMPSGLYLFCLARLSLLPPLPGAGLDGRPLCLASLGDLAAIYCDVPLEEYCGPEAAQNLQDLSWVGPRACRHQKVVEAVMRNSPVLPARFGTLFSCRERLEQLLRVHHDTVARFLDRVADQEEWAVKGLLTRALALETHLAQRLAQEGDRLEGLPAGRRYLEEQRLRRGVERELPRWLREVCQELGAALQDCALHWVQGRLSDRGGNGSGQEMILNWAYLVPKAAAAGFKARIEAANRLHSPNGLVFECTGPWPPYSFSPSLTMETDP